MRRLLLVLALGGCDIVFHIDPIATTNAGDAGALADAPPDADLGPCAGVLVGHYGTDGAGFVQVCVTSTNAVELPSLINTDSPCPVALTQMAGPSLCVYAGARIDMPGNVRVVGSRALVLVATDVITISHTIDLTGSPTEAGAAGDTPNCAAMDGVSSSGAGAGTGGGGGGSFSTAGGAGNTSATTGGNPSSLGIVAHIRGGCRGGIGGSTISAAGGVAAHSGGAIYLTSATKITVTGAIDASGGGGGKGIASPAGSSGGGGGASGGLIIFDTPQLDASAGMVWANGGGGGGGGGAGAIQTDGVTGYSSSAPTFAGTGGGGGDGSPTGGDGGAGATFGAAGGAGKPSSNGAGAGGGAGGQGFVMFYGTSAMLGTQNISPALVKL